MAGEKIYSIEFTRGILAFTICVSHFLIFNKESFFLEVLSSICVEIFFIISGFVLAPVIIAIYNENNFSNNFLIFVLRRFYRTIPLYLFFLILTSFFLNQLFSDLFLKNLFFISNFFSINLKNDYFPIVWSLSVEEWFYISFLPTIFCLKKLGIDVLYKNIIAWIIIFIVFKFILTTEYNSEEILNMRRITFLRLDSIAYGVILYLFKNKFFNLNIFLEISAVAILLVLLFYKSYSVHFKILQIFLLSVVSINILIFILKKENLFKGIFLKNVAILSGKISYGIYLNHILILHILKNILFFNNNPKIFFFVYISSVLFISLVTRKYVEEFFLKFRPKYKFLSYK